MEKLLDELDIPARRTLGGQRFLTDSELAEKLRVSRRTLLEYRSDGLIPYYLICGKILYSEQELQQYLEKCRRQSVDEMTLQ
jgi:excisionase family DNA binding protein